MKQYTCSQCGYTNSHRGQCSNCFKPLGSIEMALTSGAFSTSLLILLWVLIALVTNSNRNALAIIFGAVISFAITRYSGGIGLAFQFIATSFTIVGLLLAYTIVLRIHWQPTFSSSGLSAPPFSLDLLEYYLVKDRQMLAYMGLSILSGLYIWIDFHRYTKIKSGGRRKVIRDIL